MCPSDQKKKKNLRNLIFALQYSISVPLIVNFHHAKMMFLTNEMCWRNLEKYRAAFRVRAAHQIVFIWIGYNPVDLI